MPETWRSAAQPHGGTRQWHRVRGARPGGRSHRPELGRRMDICERFLLAPDRRAVREARLHVRAFDELPREAGANAELVVSELVANSVLHARMGPQDLIEVTLRREARHLVIEVADGGGFSRRAGS